MMNEQNRKCKGTRDLLSEEMARFRHIEGIFRDCCIKWGYQEIRTPTLEHMHLFTSTGTLTPGRLSTIYSFLDWDGWSGERVVLRPDCTIPVARLYIDESGTRTDRQKLFYIMNIFAFEQTGEESRERWQCGAEFIGGKAPVADVELIAMGLEILRLLGISNVEVVLSHVGVLRAVLQELPISEDERVGILNRVLDGNLAELTPATGENVQLERLLSMMLEQKGRSSGFISNLRSMCDKDTSVIEEALHDLENAVGLLEGLGCSFQIDMTSARGFEYYTGATFQFVVDGEKVGAGGRYDALVPLMGGKDVPACGFALYFDKLLSLLQPGAGLPSPWKGVRIVVAEASITPQMLRTCAKVAKTLRDAGFTADLDIPGSDETNWNWTLTMEDSPPVFTLVSKQGKSARASSPDEVLGLLEGP